MVIFIIESVHASTPTKSIRTNGNSKQTGVRLQTLGMAHEAAPREIHLLVVIQQVGVAA